MNSIFAFSIDNDLVCIEQDGDRFAGYHIITLQNFWIYRKDNHSWILDWLSYQGKTDWREYVEKNYREALSC